MRIKIGKKQLAILLIVVMLLYKPTTLGSVLTPIAMASSMLLLLLYGKKRGSFKYPMTRVGKKIIFPIYLYYIYCFFQEYVMSGVLNYNILKGGISILIFVITVSVFMADEPIRFDFVKGFIRLLEFWVISYIISLPLFFITSNVYELEVLGIDIPVYGYHLAFYFPFTPATGRLTLFGIQFLRLASLFRECGIAQLFYIWAFEECHYYFNKVKTHRTILLLGVVFCFSTAGYVCLIAYLVTDMVLNSTRKKNKKEFKRSIGIIVLCVAIVIAFMTVPGIKLEDKNKVSYNARITSLGNAMEAMKENPLFGTGEFFIESTGNSLLQSVYKVGLIGIGLYYAIFVDALRYSRNKKRFILANIASVLTLSLSQPIFDAPLIFLLVIIPYEGEKQMIECKGEKIIT